MKPTVHVLVIQGNEVNGGIHIQSGKEYDCLRHPKVSNLEKIDWQTIIQQAYLIYATVTRIQIGAYVLTTHIGWKANLASTRTKTPRASTPKISKHKILALIHGSEFPPLQGAIVVACF